MENKKIHQTVSKIFSAPVFPILVVFLFIHLSDGLSVFNNLFQLAVGWTFLSFIPIGIIVYADRSGWSESFDIPRRERRTRVFAAVIISYIISALIFWQFSNHILFMISIAYVVVTSAMALINFVWKISIHASGVAGPVTALVYVFGRNLAFLYLILIPVCVSRYRLKAHTKLQLIAGSVLSVAITWGLYSMFY